MKPLSKSDREILDAFAARLVIDFRCERRDGSGLRFLAGSRGTLRPADGVMVLKMRAAAAGAVDQHLRQLVRTGLIRLAGEAWIFERLPQAAEIHTVRDIIGMQKAYAPASTGS